MTGLGQFVRKTSGTYVDNLKASDCADQAVPLLVRVNEYKTHLKTKHAPNGDGEGVSVDVVNLRTNEVFVNVLWMGGAVRDQLRDYAGNGQLLPIKLIWDTSDNGNAFVTPEALEGAEFQHAANFVQQYPTYLDDQKNAKLAAWKAQQEQNAGQPASAPAFPALSGPAPQAAPAAPAPAATPAPAPAPAAPVAQPVPAQAAPAPAPAAAPAPAPMPVAAVPPAPAGQVTDNDVDALLSQL